MNAIGRVICVITALIIISAVVSAITENSSVRSVIRAVMILAMITVLVRSVSGIRLKDGIALQLPVSDADSDEVWNITLDYLEEQLERDFYDICRQNGLYVDDISVSLSHNGDGIEIDEISISGRDSSSAKNVIAGHFKLQLAYINISGEQNGYN